MHTTLNSSMGRPSISLTLAVAVVLALVAMAFATDAQAASKPGLWEMTTQMQYTQGGPKMQQMPKMTPEQLAMMKQMGINMPAGGPGGPMTMQICVTPEMAAKQEGPPMGPEQQDCSMRNAKQSGNTFSGDIVCKGRLNGTGKVQSTQAGDHYKGFTTFSGTSADSGPIAYRNDFSGRWLGANCGTVKPLGVPKAPPPAAKPK